MVTDVQDMLREAVVVLIPYQFQRKSLTGRKHTYQPTRDIATLANVLLTVKELEDNDELCQVLWISKFSTTVLQSKFASIDGVGFLIGRHTFKMATLMSIHWLPASPSSACDIISSLYKVNSIKRYMYINRIYSYSYIQTT